MINVPGPNVVASSNSVCVRPGSVKSLQSPCRKPAVVSLTDPKRGCRNKRYRALSTEQGPKTNDTQTCTRKPGCSNSSNIIYCALPTGRESKTTEGQPCTRTIEVKLVETIKTILVETRRYCELWPTFGIVRLPRSWLAAQIAF